MSSDDHTAAITSSLESSEAFIDRVEQGILSRRTFLAGLGIGSIGGMVVGSERISEEAQFSAALAGRSTQPAKTEYYLPATDSPDTGLVITVAFEFEDGNGGLFVNLDGVEVRHDLQLALREAVQTATRLTGDSLANTATHATFETLDSDILALRGKSWEAGLTVALVAALRQRSLSADTLITGVVDDEGELLPVGGIDEKARAAREAGATELLIPDTEDDEADDIAVQDLRVTKVESITNALDRIL